MKKEKLIQVLEDTDFWEHDYFAVAIETEGNPGVEIIVNPRCNLNQKAAYYNKSYDDDLRLLTFPGIRIVGACSFDEKISVDEIVERMELEVRSNL